MGKAEALAMILGVACTGCLTARTSLGPSVSPAGGEERVSVAVGFGVADEKGQIMALAAAQPGTRSFLSVGGLEYDRNLRSDEKPLGIRVRLEGGVQLEHSPPESKDDAASVLVAAIPGVWWTPFQHAFQAHRLVMAIEPRIGATIPTLDPSAVGPFFDLAFVLEWDWVPCTFFGGSCRPRAQPPVR